MGRDRSAPGPQQRLGMLERAGFSLLEIQVSVLLAAFVFAGLAGLMVNTSTQLKWLESSSSSSGTTSPVGLVMMEPQVILKNQSLTGKFTVQVRSVVDDGGTYVVTVERKAAAAGDCGR